VGAHASNMPASGADDESPRPQCPPWDPSQSRENAVMTRGDETDALREDARRLASEQAALRRVALLVAGGAPPAEVFDAVVEELGALLGVGSAALVRYDGTQQAGVLAGWGRLGEEVPRGGRPALGGGHGVSR